MAKMNHNRMTVQEIMERVGTNETGRAMAYIRDALDEMALLSPSHTNTARIDIEQNKRFYSIPFEAIQILNIRCKNHNNSDDNYKEIPRMVYEPEITDSDGV